MKKSAEERESLFLQRLMRRAGKGLKVPQEFSDCAELLVLNAANWQYANEHAVVIAKMRRSNECGLSDIRAYCKEHRVDELMLSRFSSVEKSNQQSEAGKNRWKNKTPTIRTLTIESMHTWRVDSHTLDEFIEAAKNNSIGGLEMEEYEEKNKRRFKLGWEREIDEKASSSLRTLEDWWKEAKSTTD